jgi:hypothetical protein
MEVVIRSPPQNIYIYVYIYIYIYIYNTHKHTHSHVPWNRPHVSPRMHIRLYNLVAWTIKTFEWQ